MAADTHASGAELERVIWQPQAGPQTAFVTCPVYEVVYGGARGGGKTDGVLGEWLSHADLYGKAAKGLMVRRKRTQLVDTILRAQELYLPLGAKWLDTEKTFIFPDGARLRMSYLERDADAEEYQGHSYTRLYVEELTNFADPRPIMKLKATLRSSSGVKVGMRATCNPGGAGHNWVKARYIDPAPNGFKVLTDDDGLERVFIPAKIRDNPKLFESDPGYVSRLRQVGSESLVKAWLNGDWNVVDGAFFDCWDAVRHVVRPFAIPPDWLRFRSMDWGSAKPFSVGWWAVAGDEYHTIDGVTIPRGCLVRYREWYGMAEGQPNVGLKMTAEEVAAGIAAREQGEHMAYAVLDPAAFAQDGGPSIAERMYTSGKVHFGRADNKRVGLLGALGGWDMMRARMKGDDDGNPMMVVFSTCEDFIRTVPGLQHDDKRPEDIDTEGEDHVADEARYACMSRPWVPARNTKPKGRTLPEMSMNDLWKARGKQSGVGRRI